MSIQFAPTWNNAAVTQTCIRANATDTGSAAASTLIELSVNGTTQFAVDKTGDVILRESTPQTPPSGYIAVYGNSGRLNVINSSGSSSSIISSLNGLTDATQTFAVGTTGTDVAVSSASGVHTLNIPSASATARGVVTTGTQTFAGAKTFSGNVGVGGASPSYPLSLPLYQWISWGGSAIVTSDGNNLRLGDKSIDQLSALNFGVSSNRTTVITEGDNILAQRRSTNAQGFRIYNTYTSSTSFERLNIGWSGSVCTIGTEKGSAGGSATDLTFATDATTRLVIPAALSSGAMYLGPRADDTSTGGNARGANAVDLQTVRTAANQVASGAGAFLAGRRSRASGDSSFCFGDDSVASGQYSVAIGNYQQATNYGATTFGINGLASGNQSMSLSMASGGTASGQNSFICGQGTSSATNSWATGFNVLANRQGMAAYANGRFAADGDVQRVEWLLRNKTTDGTTAVTLFANGSSARCSLTSGKVLHATVLITGSKSDGSAVAAYLRQVSIKNVGGTTSLVGTVNTLGTDTAAGTSIAITADDTNGALQIAVTGVDSETWRWTAVVYGVEIAYGT